MMISKLTTPFNLSAFCALLRATTDDNNGGGGPPLGFKLLPELIAPKYDSHALGK
jgi:hypothetical protein